MKKTTTLSITSKKKRERKDGVLFTKSDYSRTEETVIDKTFE